MEYTNFINEIYLILSKDYEDFASISLDHRLRNNNVEIDSITIRANGYNVAPTIHLTPYYGRYLDGVSLADIIDDIKKTYELTAPHEDFDVSKFLDFNKAKSQICMRLINYNQNRDLLEDLPYIQILDLAVIFSYIVPEEWESSASILIHNEHLQSWNVSVDQLYELALSNSPKIFPASLQSMNTWIKTIYLDHDMPEYMIPVDSTNPDMYILTNDSCIYGASALLYPDLINDIANQLDSDLIIIPSSIHEVILLTEKEPVYHNLCRMIEEVNEMELATVDVLSDHPYFYHRADQKITY